MTEVKDMSVFDLFSKRQKKLRGEVPDIYIYDDIPKPLRVQIIHILRDTLGSESEFIAGGGDFSYTYQKVREAYGIINQILCKEYGVFSLVRDPSSDCVVTDLFKYFLNEKDCEKVLDVVELSFRFIDECTRKYDYKGIQRASEKADGAINELNTRFKEHGIGYEYRNGKIIRIDSELIHSEAVKPALILLSDKQFKTANTEFLQAHDHYRHGRYKDSLNWALKSLESTLKTICDKRKWPFNPNDTSKKLIEICFQKELISSFWQSHFSALRSTLESGVPTARNQMSGHGDGTKPIEVPQYLAAYCLHMTASTLVFLIEAEKNLGK
jgi:hypothetical protein